MISVIMAGIGWEPEIRGALTVALATAALVGTVWLLLVTNTGVRLGSMVTLAGFFGWFAIMAGTWWIFGIGYSGDAPSWRFIDSYADSAGAEVSGIEDAYLADVDQLPDPNCSTERIFPPSKTGWQFSATPANCAPRAIALVLNYPGSNRQAVIDELATVDEAGIRETAETRNALRQVGDPRKLSEMDLERSIQEQITRQEVVIDQLSLSALAASAPSVIDWAKDEGYISLRGGWDLLPSTEAGEATAAAEAVVVEAGMFDSDPDAATPAYALVDTYHRGGKPNRISDSTWDRVANKITNTLRLTHPPNYAVVQMRPVVPRPQVPGEPPPLAEIDLRGDTLSVVLERDIGDRRLVPGLLTIGSGLIFLSLCLNLHMRDLRVRRRDELEAGAKAEVN